LLWLNIPCETQGRYGKIRKTMKNDLPQISRKGPLTDTTRLSSVF